MIPSIEALTTTALSFALDAAGVRQRVIAANIAHAGRPGHAALRADFEAQATGEALRLHTRLSPARASDGTALPVQLDAELASLARNALQYQALVKGLRAHLGLVSLAVSEGRA